MTDSFTFYLKNKIKFSNRKTGTHDDAVSVTLRGPSYNERKLAYAMKQHIMKATVAMASLRGRAEESKSSAPQDPNEIPSIGGPEIEAVLMGGSADFDNVMADFEEIVLACGEFAEKCPVTRDHIKEIYEQGLLEQLMGEYCAHFFGSWLVSDKKTAGG